MIPVVSPRKPRLGTSRLYPLGKARLTRDYLRGIFGHTDYKIFLMVLEDGFGVQIYHTEEDKEERKSFYGDVLVKISHRAVSS
jgi:hypothetical protein